MRLLTSSSLKTWRRCPREYRFRYVDLLEPVNQDDVLRFGSLFHVGLEFWWRALMHGLVTDPARLVELAIESMRGVAGDFDAYDLARAEELFIAYAVRWADQGFEVLAVEVEFQAPLINPDSGQPSRTFRQAGKIDAIVRRPDGSVWVVEHKTSGEDIAPGSTYWQRLRMDGQVSAYFDGGDALGYEVVGVIYDVAKTPAQRPLEATPVELRKYTKATAKEPSRLYSNQRDADETVDEYRARVRAALVEDPGAYFARGEVVRLESERREHLMDTWQFASAIRESARTGCAPRNPDGCQRYGRFCSYMPICTGEAAPDDLTRYRVREAEHPELSHQPATTKEVSHVSNSSNEAA